MEQITENKTVDTNSAILETSTVQEFMKSKGFVSVVKTVRKNTNGYPYITFMNASNVAENIYFSKNGASKVDEGDLIEKGFFNPFTMVLAVNADGEQRWKISSGDSLRLSVEDLF